MAEFGSWLQPTKADYYMQRLSVRRTDGDPRIPDKLGNADTGRFSSKNPYSVCKRLCRGISEEPPAQVGKGERDRTTRAERVEQDPDRRR